MPQSIANPINLSAWQLTGALLALSVVLFAVSRYSLSQLAQASDFPEKRDLLRGARLLWFVLPLAGLVGVGAMVLILNVYLLPLTAFTAGAMIVLTTIVVMIYRHADSMDGLFAGVEMRLARDFDTWLQRHRARLERRHRVGWLRHVLAIGRVPYAIPAVAGYVTVDRTLATRLHSMAVAETVQRELGPQAGTIFSQTPPCVLAPTLYIVPSPGEAASVTERTWQKSAALLKQLDPGQKWRVVIRTGETTLPPVRTSP